MSWTVEAYQKVADRRQIILHYLATRPGASKSEINAAVRATGDDSDLMNTLATMIDWNEIRSEGSRSHKIYFALKHTTRSAEECIEMREDKAKKSLAIRRENNGQDGQATTIKPGHYIHRPGAHPIKGQRGQGAVRARVYASAGTEL
jgi:hypothetical protein